MFHHSPRVGTSIPAGTVQSIAGKWGSYGTRFSTGASLSSWAKAMELHTASKMVGNWLEYGRNCT